MSQRKKSNKSVSRSGRKLPQAEVPQAPVLPSANQPAIAVHQCLVLSLDPERRQMLSEAATSGGWRPIMAADVASARTGMSRMWAQLALVDLENVSASERDAIREFVEEISDTNGLLLVICGNEGDAAEENWVRQLGAWLYLPGVSTAGDVSVLCGDARHISGQLHASYQYGVFTPASPAVRPA